MPPAAELNYFTANLQFFSGAPFPHPTTAAITSLSLDSIELHEVHSLALECFPAAFIPALTAVLTTFVTAALRNLDEDAPTLAIYSIPRLLLQPPPPDLNCRQIASHLRQRVESLRHGNAAQLWHAYDWLGALSSPLDFPTRSLAASSAQMTKTSAHSPTLPTSLRQ